MEDWVHGAEGWGKLQHEGMSASLGYDFVGTKVTFRRFLGGSCHAEMFCLDKDLITYFEGWCGEPQSISILLSILLCFEYGGPQMLVEFVQVGDELLGSRGGKIALWVNGKVRMITFICEEG